MVILHFLHFYYFQISTTWLQNHSPNNIGLTPLLPIKEDSRKKKNNGSNINPYSSKNV